MVFEPISTFNFEEIEHARYAKPYLSAEFITFRKNDVYLSKNLYKRLGSPEYVVVAVDKGNRLVGVKPASDTDTRKYKCGSFYYGSCRLEASTIISAKISEILPAWDPERTNIRLSSGKVVEDYIAFDLDTKTVITRRFFSRKDK